MLTAAIFRNTDRSFVQLCLDETDPPEHCAGFVKLVDKFVDMWHSSNLAQCRKSLPNALGLTDSEYARWLKEPDSLVEVIQRRRKQPNARQG